MWTLNAELKVKILNAERLNWIILVNANKPASSSASRTFIRECPKRAAQKPFAVKSVCKYGN